jgi:AcrR family transcriptional regulator
VVAVRQLTPAQRAAVDHPHARARAAAVQLAESRSFAEITVDEIASLAGMSRRTFFRYFPTKEDVLFSDHADHLERMREHLPSRSATDAELVAALDLVATGFDEARHFVLRRKRLIRESGLLQEREALWFAEYQKLLAEASADEDRRRAETLAAALVASLRHSLEVWTAAPASVDLRNDVRVHSEEIVARMGRLAGPAASHQTDVVIVRTALTADEVAETIRRGRSGLRI